MNSIDTGLGSSISNQSTVITNNQAGFEKTEYTFQNELSSSCCSTFNLNLHDEKENRFEKHIELMLDINNNGNVANLSNEIHERKEQNVKNKKKKNSQKY